MEKLTFIEACGQKLRAEWEEVLSAAAENDAQDFLSTSEAYVIKQILTSRTKTYHYVLPTQLLAKSVDPALDCRSLQASFPFAGAFDARTVAHEVIVPFDRQNNSVLGGSSEPYVNNPLRVPGVTVEYRTQQKNKTDWDLLVQLLGNVEQEDSPIFTMAVFRQVLLEVYRLLSDSVITYPTPHRISYSNTVAIVEQFLQNKSGGERLESVVAALFRVIGQVFNVYDEVVRTKVNAADASTGMIADVECKKAGKVVLAVEVKDQVLTLTAFETTVEAARAKGLTEVLFIESKKRTSSTQGELQIRVSQEFTSGHNIYIIEFLSFIASLLILFGEEGRSLFIRKIGEELDRGQANIIHRKAWAELLRGV